MPAAKAQSSSSGPQSAESVRYARRHAASFATGVGRDGSAGRGWKRRLSAPKRERARPGRVARQLEGELDGARPAMRVACDIAASASGRARRQRSAAGGRAARAGRSAGADGERDEVEDVVERAGAVITHRRRPSSVVGVPAQLRAGTPGPQSSRTRLGRRPGRDSACRRRRRPATRVTSRAR